MPGSADIGLPSNHLVATLPMRAIQVGFVLYDVYLSEVFRATAKELNIFQSISRQKLQKVSGPSRGHQYFVACSGWTPKFQGGHRTHTIPDHVDKNLLARLLAGQALIDGNDKDTKPCSLFVHAHPGLRQRYCPHAHIKNGQQVRSKIVQHRCLAKRSIYVPLFRAFSQKKSRLDPKFGQKHASTEVVPEVRTKKKRPLWGQKFGQNFQKGQNPDTTSKGIIMGPVPVRFLRMLDMLLVYPNVDSLLTSWFPRHHTNIHRQEPFRNVEICPPDKSMGTSITNHTAAEEGYRTTTVLFHDTSNFSHLIVASARLDLAFVKSVLSSTGPNTARTSQRSLWDWADWRVGVSKSADGEPAYYPWLEWAVYAPAAHAAAAVRDRLYESAGQAVPLSCQGTSTIRCVTANGPTGVTDIILELEREEQDDDEDEERGPVACTLHEVKRAAVLTVDGVSVLKDLVTWARRNEGFKFRQEVGRSQEKARRLLFQHARRWMNLYNTTSRTSSSPPNIITFCSASGLPYQFLVSRLYKINDSITQLQDITELVLFYAHAIVIKVTGEAYLHKKGVCQGSNSQPPNKNENGASKAFPSRLNRPW
ncbi:hypothetical protein B0H13DRAFT_2511787 [Mycena leptocephala]|nr:hypothetical protein B0H13DRAFT_2511787 [Mycena leptocephala]